MGAANSRGAFTSMTEEQPLTPTPPRHEMRDGTGSRHFGLPVSWSPHNGSVQPAVENSSSSQALHEVFEGSSDGADEENVKVGEQVHSDVPVILESGIDKPESPTDTEPYFVEYTPVAAKLKPDGRSPNTNEGSARKNKLTNLLRTLSASAASSSARMTPKSSAAGDCKLMVEFQERAEVIPDDEVSPTEKIPPEIEDQPVRPSVRKMFSLTTRRSSGTPMGSSSKYSPISDD